jgi:hypothetical protein
MDLLVEMYTHVMHPEMGPKFGIPTWFPIVHINVKFNLNYYKYHAHEKAHFNLLFQSMFVGREKE